MNYYSLFHLTREPFANSPDPDLFYHSVQHHDCLQKLELALRLRRGLSVVIGAVGTGKSTMCRALLKRVADDSGAVKAHLILDPDFSSSQEFLATIIKTFGIEDDCNSEWQMKEAIKNYLIHQGVDRDTIPVLIIDEGQKLPDFCIEILREFLNFETNQNKLLEIVIFAQQEFTETLKSRPNFSDRITSYHTLSSLSFRETRNMIRYRIEQCREDGKGNPELFPFPSLLLIFLLTKGYPRKIVMLCSKVLLAMLVKEKIRATVPLVWNCAGETSTSRLSPLRKGIYTVGITIFLCTTLLLFTGSRGFIMDAKNWLLPDQPVVQQVENPTLPLPVELEGFTSPEEIRTEAPIIAHRENSLDRSDSSNPPPDELGHLMVLKGMSLSRMVTRVYGSFSEYNISMVLKANPYLTDPARLKVQTKIFFPQLANSPTSKFTPVLVSLGQFATLQSAYDYLISGLKTKKVMRILPIWNGLSKLSFLVVLDEIFPDEAQAQQAITRLDSRFRSTAVVLNELDGIPL